MTSQSVSSPHRAWLRRLLAPFLQSGASLWVSLPLGVALSWTRLPADQHFNFSRGYIGQHKDLCDAVPSLNKAEISQGGGQGFQRLRDMLCGRLVFIDAHPEPDRVTSIDLLAEAGTQIPVRFRKDGN